MEQLPANPPEKENESSDSDSRSEQDPVSVPVSVSVPVPPFELSWESLGLSADALELIRKANFRAPTPVQAATIPVVLQGRDVIASAQTGTGKTASFVLPLVERIAGRQGTYGLILAPTREIAVQTQATIELFGTPRGVRSVVLIGGIDMKIDLAAIRAYPQIIVATPGRLCDHLDRGNIWLDFLEAVVLDEADRMLDMGFADQLARIMEEVPKKRQTMLFSATMPPDVERLARRILQNPERIAIGRPTSAAKTVEQKVYWTTDESKNRDLLRLVEREPGSIIVFVRTKDAATRVYRFLHGRGVHDSTYISSDRPQDQREQALTDFKEGKFRVLVATDVAGRGIHVEGVAHVVNYDLPEEPEDYIHRVGRTGRLDATGKATTFVTPRDRRSLARIEGVLGVRILSDRSEQQGRPEQQASGRSSEARRDERRSGKSGAGPGAPAGAPEGGAHRRRRRRRRRGGSERPPTKG